MPVLKFNVQKSTLDGVDGALVFESIVSNFHVPLMAVIGEYFVEKCRQRSAIRIIHEEIVFDSIVPDIGGGGPASTTGADIDDATCGVVSEGRADQKSIIFPDVPAADPPDLDRAATNGLICE